MVSLNTDDKKKQSFFSQCKTTKEKHIYFDTTFLHYGEDLRGIPQVIMQLVRLFNTSELFRKIHFIATKKVSSKYLLPLGVEPCRIVYVNVLPFLPKEVLFHGLFSSFRYRKIVSSASLIIHGEFRTVQKTMVPQVVVYHDLFLINHFIESIPSTKSFLKKTIKLFIYRYLHCKLKKSLLVKYKIANSDFTRKELLTTFPLLSPQSIIALPIGSRSCFSQQSPVCSRGLTDSFSFLYVGGILDPRKNVFTMLENIHVVAQNRPFHLHLVGKIHPDSCKVKLEERLRSLQIDGKVTLHGLLPDIELNALYKKANFFLFPSLKEGFGLPIIEAMAHGLVVCAFNHTSIPEIGGNALVLSESNDFASWGKAIARLVNNPSEYQQISEKAIVVAKNFSEEKMFERYNNYFLQIINQ